MFVVGTSVGCRWCILPAIYVLCINDVLLW